MGYSYWDLFANIGYILFGAPTNDPTDIDALTDEQLEKVYRRNMCSQAHSFFIRRCAGWDLCDKADRSTTPNDLYRTPRLRTTCDRVDLTVRPKAFPFWHRRSKWMPR